MLLFIVPELLTLEEKKTDKKLSFKKLDIGTSI